MVEWDDVAKGLVAGMLERQIEARGSTARWIAVAVMVLGVLSAVLFGGFVRGLGITIALLGLIALLTIALVRAVAMTTIRKFATPQSIAEKREEIDRAMDRADLPTGPLSVIRFVYRLRRGVGAEVERLDVIIEDLREELAASEPSAGELNRPSTPELES